ncbi:phosphomannomutase [Thioclava dalianensis]|uniref:Phosphomannomutase n=1 Tax=Thioclava dalianensis TaxID=1185766 RepID=A0A074T9K8_9RHOB|nr:hypothetical protein [Thioclava dalianensis]KEP68491.1 phosphomannomutase [Thioclava dalianensis]SFN34377.1 phosphomannomutase [Thioclava dalianensis]
MPANEPHDTPRFGTSGLRGRIELLTRACIADHTRAFLATGPTGGVVHLGHDLRPSSRALSAWLCDTLQTEGITVHDCGALPTPALAHRAIVRGHAAIMVTGSHLAADRNGLKFFRPAGEITKSDEQAISAALNRPPATGPRGPAVAVNDPTSEYRARYHTAFGADALRGLRLGVFQHSSVARDLMVTSLTELCAQVIPFGRSNSFRPLDTEALDSEIRAEIETFCAAHSVDAVLSTDADADRPLLTDATGQVWPGDVLGACASRDLGASEICTPITSNSLITALPGIQHTHFTKIGSPYVIAAMYARQRCAPGARLAGYEANGGFLLGFEVQGPAGMLAPLLTRDSLLPMIAVLSQIRRTGQSLAERRAALPRRFTASDRIAGVETSASHALIDHLTRNADARQRLVPDMGPEREISRIDGLRIGFACGRILHIRRSGNAPELRIYTEAETQFAAEKCLKQCRKSVETRLAQTQRPVAQS